MHAEDVLFYGHQTVLKSIDGIPADEWNTPGVTGVWSMKDVIAHLASHEQVFVEILGTLIGGAPAPTLEQFKMKPGLFNDQEVARRKGFTTDQVLSEYLDAQSRSNQLINQVAIDRRRLLGTLSWYGEGYDLEDYITYGVYGHKREHSAQIEAFKDRLLKKYMV